MRLTSTARLVSAVCGLTVSALMLVIGQRMLWIDHWVLGLIMIHRQADWNQAVLKITQLGTFDVLAPVGLVIALVLAFFDRRAAAFAAVTMATSAALMQGLKYLVARPRPGPPWAVAELSNYSFPSGHSMATMTLALTMTLVFSRLAPNWLRSGTGVAVIASLLCFTLIISFTRVYLGAHYPSDVVAGWALALAWVSLMDHLWYRDYRPATVDTVR